MKIALKLIKSLSNLINILLTLMSNWQTYSIIWEEKNRLILFLIKLLANAAILRTNKSGLISYIPCEAIYNIKMDIMDKQEKASKN
jgi:hypothetical protein